VTRRPAGSWPDRLAVARELVACGAPAPSVDLADQLGAAGKEARGLHDRIGALASALHAGRPWYHRREHAVEDDVRAYLVAAVLDCLPDSCSHLRKGGPQPALALLPLRRIACVRCAGQVHRPPAEDAGRWDVCGTRNVMTFVPFAMQLGPTIIGGDACPACADVLGIRAGREMSV
jgi:hypothetical protein